jgi:hypothetical protein
MGNEWRNRDLEVEEAFAGALSEDGPVAVGLAVGSFEESGSFLYLPSSLPTCIATLTTLSHFWCTCWEASAPVPALSGETEGR